MTDDWTDRAAVADDLQTARVAYGGLLVGEGITVVACDDDPDGVPTGLLTAIAAARDDLERFVGETEDALGTDLGAIAAPHLREETPAVTSFSRAGALAARSRAVYLQAETASRGWIRLRDAAPSAFREDDPAPGILALSATVLADARDRIAAQPPAVQDRLREASSETE